MTSTGKDGMRLRTQSRIAAAIALAAFTLVATGTSTVAGTTPPSSDETTTTAPAATTTPEATTPSTDDAAATTTAPAATTAPTAFAAALAEQCEGDTGHQLLASGLQVVMGDDGSLRIVEILLACDVVFVGAVDPELGRPSTNVEAIIADPANNVTPNQAQIDLLNEELASYWRIAEAWAEAQTAVASGTEATESSVPAPDVASSGPEEPATTGG